MASEAEQQMYDELNAKGCCKRCILRYLNQPLSLITFDDPDTSLINFGLIPPVMAIANEKKRIKRNPCVVCLDLLSDEMLEKMLTDNILSEAESYRFESFHTYITYPKCIHLRDNSMKIHLKHLFPSSFDKDHKCITINHAWRYSINEKLCEVLNKKYMKHAKLAVHFYTDYILDDDELSIMKHRARGSTKDYGSRHFVAAVVDSLNDDEFKALFPVPPKTPNYSATFTKVAFVPDNIHLIGKYCKYSRELYQQPFIENHKIVHNHSIQTIIAEALQALDNNFSRVTFEASSYDHKKVRVLGKGRTFYLQVCEPRFESFTSDRLREIENKIRESGVLDVKNLQQDVRRNAIYAIKSESLVPYMVRLACIVYDCQNIERCVNAINMYRNIVVTQNTPIKMLVQRDVRIKTKRIYQIAAKHMRDNFVEVQLCVDSGLFIEEFVHGDCGRTQPSLCEIVKAKIDLLALDVLEFRPTTQCVLEEEDVTI